MIISKNQFVLLVAMLFGAFGLSAQSLNIVVTSAAYNSNNYSNYDPNGSVTGTFTVQINKDANSYNNGDFRITVALPSASPIAATAIAPPGFIVVDGGQPNQNFVAYEISAPWTGTTPSDVVRIFTIPIKIINTATNQIAQANLQWDNPFEEENEAGNVASTLLNVQNVPLPVKLASFSARKVQQTSLLNWKTTAEQHNIGFDIERSQDGKLFTKIGFEATQATNGNSSTALDYKFVDEKPMTGINYYRLKQMDIDGKFVYSDIASVSFGNGTKQAITVYPNPAVNSVTVTAQEVSKIELYNVMGQLVNVPISYEANSSLINTSGLANGNYTLRVVSGTDVSNHKLVIKK